MYSNKLLSISFLVFLQQRREYVLCIRHSLTLTTVLKVIERSLKKLLFMHDPTFRYSNILSSLEVIVVRIGSIFIPSRTDDDLIH